MTNVRKLILVGVAAVSLGLTACDDSSNNDGDTNTEKNPATAGNEDAGSRVGGGDSGVSADAAPAVKLTDPQIAGVTTAANTGEIAQANAALPKLTDPDIKAYAQEMITAHGAAQMRQEKLLMSKGISPQDSNVSVELKTESDAIVAQLSAAAAPAIDGLYIDSQVTVHAKVLETLDTILIPSAEDAQIRQELVATRGDVNMHLEHAKQLRDALANKQ